VTAEDATPGYPLTLDVRGRRAVVVGGGPVAARRAQGLVDAGAEVEVVAPELCEGLHDLVAGRGVAWTERDYEVGDLVTPQPAWLVHTATGDRDTDDAVSAHADAARIWCVRADDAGRSSAWTPAVARGRPATVAEGLTVAVGGGGDPRRAVAVRDAVEAALESGTLPVRRVRRGRDRTGAGRVSLVGGGPGAEDLLTVRGRALLATADVVVADRLGPRDVLDRLGGDVEVIDVGKTPGRHPVPQERINEILVDHARRGAHVVRLKGGDPFVLGRGGEEALHCAEHGIPVEVVPGVTSAVSVPAAAGIPVTHRGVTTSFVVVSGHEGPDAVVAAAAAAPGDATLVLLMAVTRLGETAAGLVAAGSPTETPVAVVESGWTPAQRVTWTTLATAGADAQAAGVRPPAVVVIGDVVSVGRALAAVTSPSRPAVA
jgi:uroporphyrin-III C-methyltransferase/precorrin-2 dehydrogenase/sirohydrochlorin ferrochelatase